MVDTIGEVVVEAAVAGLNAAVSGRSRRAAWGCLGILLMALVIAILIWAVL